MQKFCYKSLLPWFLTFRIFILSRSLDIAMQWMPKQLISRVNSIYSYLGIQSIELALKYEKENFSLKYYLGNRAHSLSV